MTTTRSRASALVTALIALVGFRLSTETVGLVAAYRGRAVGRVFHHPGSLAVIWRQWDVGWFARIATQGYPASANVRGFHGEHFDGTAFPPAMPVLMAAGRAVGVDPSLAGLLVSTLFLFVALALLFRLVRLDHPDGVARWTLAFLLVYPFALFLGTAYAEALVLMATVAAWLAARGGRWWVAGVMVGVALLGKIVFIVLLVPLSLEAVGWDGRFRVQLDRPAALRLLRLWLPALAALGAWMLYLGIQFHEPTRFLSAQRGWGRAVGLPFGQVADIFRPAVHLGIRLSYAIDTLALVDLVAMTVYVYRRVRPAYAALLAVIAAIFLFNTSLQSNARHLGILFPIFIGLAVMTQGRRWVRVVLVAVQLPIAALAVARFATGQWAG
ncbi:MAG: hypothetical protein ABR598_03940 [Candidatus Dormibacteria bacterium]